MEKARFTLGAFAIILNEQQHILLCHRRDRDWWNLPGGGVLSGETPWEAIIREVQEEVGLVVIVNRLVGVYAYTPEDDLIFSFLCTRTGGKLTLSNEADAINYFALEDLPPTTHLHHLLRIRDALACPEQLQLKTHPLFPLRTAP